ncbi:MAG: hypothetical protein K6L81_14665 [Agarilytica sp.]
MNMKVLGLIYVLLVSGSFSERALSQSLEDAQALFDEILSADIDQFKKGFTHQIIILPMGDLNIPIQIERETDSVIESVCSLINEPECVQVLTDLEGLHSLDKPYETVFDDCWDDALEILIDGIFDFVPYRMDVRLARLELILKVELFLSGIDTEVWSTFSDGSYRRATMEEVFWRNVVRSGLIPADQPHNEYELKNCEYVFGELAYQDPNMWVSNTFTDFETGNDIFGICDDLQRLAELQEVSMWGDDASHSIRLHNETHRYGGYVNDLFDAYRILRDDENSCGYEDEDLDAARELFHNASLAEQVSTLLYLVQLFDDAISEEEMKKMLKYLAIKNIFPLWDHADEKRKFFLDMYGSSVLFQVPVPFLD